MEFTPTTVQPPEILHFEPPAKPHKPVLISSPHSGVLLTDGLLEAAAGEWVNANADCDWFVHELYDFAPAMGLGLVQALYSRFVVDLNRPRPGEPSLYPGTSRISSVVPKETFRGEPVYREGFEPDASEIERRLHFYYQPYYDFLGTLLHQMRSQWSQVLFWDAHSIRSYVPRIRNQPFEDLNLSSRDGSTCSEELIHRLKLVGLDHGYSVTVDNPFKGGHLTRSMAAPSQGIMALQLEISQATYLEDDGSLGLEKTAKLKLALKEMLSEASSLVESGI